LGALKKTTVLEGYYATGDNECFCFDKHKNPEVHREAEKNAEDPKTWDACRVYPDNLIPEGADEKKGKWTITIEFEAEPTPEKSQEQILEELSNVSSDTKRKVAPIARRIAASLDE